MSSQLRLTHGGHATVGLGPKLESGRLVLLEAVDNTTGASARLHLTPTEAAHLAREIYDRAVAISDSSDDVGPDLDRKVGGG